MENRVDDKGIQKAFRKLAQVAQNPEPALKDIGEY